MLFLQEVRVNPEVYKALAMHAAKVLALPPAGLQQGFEGRQYVDVSKKGGEPFDFLRYCKQYARDICTG